MARTWVILGYTQTVGWELIHPEFGCIFFSKDELRVRCIKYLLDDDIELERYDYYTIMETRILAKQIWSRVNKKYNIYNLGNDFTIKERKKYIKYCLPKKNKRDHKAEHQRRKERISNRRISEEGGKQLHSPHNRLGHIPESGTSGLES